MMKIVITTWKKALQSWPLTQRWGRAWGARTLIAAMVVVLLLISLAFSDWSHGPEIRHFTKVTRGDFHVTLVEAGDVEAVSERGITAPMMWGAKLQIIDLVPEGALVKKGDFLVQFDAADLESSLDLAKDNLETLQADLNKLDAQQTLSITNHENSLLLSQYSLEQARLSLEMQQFESDVRREEARIATRQAELDLATTQKQLESQRIIHRSERMKKLTAIRQAKLKIQSIENRIAQMQLTAPIDGMVVYQYYRGERVKKGLEARPGQPLISIPDLDRMRIKLYINEVDRLKVQLGQTAEITLDAYPELSFEGKVVEMGRLAQAIRHDVDLKGFEVLVDVFGSDQRLRPGMTAKVAIHLETVEDVLFVPLAAIHEKDGETVVFFKGKHKPHAVTLGLRNDGYAVVSGVKADQELQWNDPQGVLPLYGFADEKRRVEEIRIQLGHSFSVFKERGMLYDYIKKPATQAVTSADSVNDGAANVDIRHLPASLRNRLNRDNKGKTEHSTVSVGTPDKLQAGKMKLSPSLMKRLKPSQAKSPQKK